MPLKEFRFSGKEALKKEIKYIKISLTAIIFLFLAQIIVIAFFPKCFFLLIILGLLFFAIIIPHYCFIFSKRTITEFNSRFNEFQKQINSRKIKNLFFDIDNTITIGDKAKKRIISSFLLLLHYKRINLFLITGRDWKYTKRILISFLSSLKGSRSVKRATVKIACEMGAVIIDISSLEKEISKAFIDNALAEEKTREIIKSLFWNYKDLNFNVQNEKNYFKDAEKNPFLIPQNTKKPLIDIAYISPRKEKIISAEFFRNRSGNIPEEISAKIEESAKKSKDWLKKNHLEKKIAVLSCGTAIDFVPIINGQTMDKSVISGHLIKELAKKNGESLKKICKESIVFGDGESDFAIANPKINGKRIGKIRMIYVGKDEKLRGKAWIASHKNKYVDISGYDVLNKENGEMTEMMLSFLEPE